MIDQIFEVFMMQLGEKKNLYDILPFMYGNSVRGTKS